MAKIKDVKELDELKNVSMEDVIKEKLEYLNEDYNTLSDRVIKYLITIETIINDKKTISEDAISTIKENKINLNTISTVMGISRTTLYNNKVLKKYINYSIDMENENNPYCMIEKLKSSKKELENQIFDMVDRDINIEFMNQEIIQLKNEIHKKIEECNRMKERRNVILAENTELKGEVRKLKEQLLKKEGNNVKQIKDFCNK